MSSELEVNEAAETESFSQSVLGAGFFKDKTIQKWLRYPDAWRVAASAVALACLLFLPYLGAVGLWDPWEVHYGEVAREMIQRNDFVHPFWENAWFFSKPAFTMWMQALGMQIVGSNRTEGALGLYTEWGFRLPFALFSVLAVGLMAYALARVVSVRAGLASAFVLCTMPMYFLLTRQAVTDTPFVNALIAGMACAIIGQLDTRSKHRAAWWYGFYIFCAIATLAKGLLGFGLPGVILVLYAGLSVIPWTGTFVDEHLNWLIHASYRREVREGTRAMPALWAQCFRMKLGTGVGVFVAVAIPWYAVMFAFDQVDDESHLFWYRFLIHDHLNRLGAGVHTTTPGGTFTYFLEQGGYAIFPWVALLPGAISHVSSLKLRSLRAADHVGIIAAIWLAFTFALMGASATKFHHYVFPMLPPIAILIALFIDRLWVEGIAKHGISLIFGLPFFILVGKDLSGTPKNFTDLFVYNYDRPYPIELVTKQIQFSSTRPLWMGDLLALSLIGLGSYLLLEHLGKTGSKGGKAFGLLLTAVGAALLPTLFSRGTVGPTLWVGVALALVALSFLAYESAQHAGKGMWVLAFPLGLGGAALAVIGAQSAKDPLLAPLLETVNIKAAMGFAFTLGGTVCALAALSRAKTLMFGAFWALAFSFALWFNWSHWVDLSHHWTQRDQFWRYYEQRKPGEPIAAFLMNWRGETFYSRNTVKQLKDNGALLAYANQPGREWALVEHARLGVLKAAVGADKTVTLIDRDLNNKFVLVTID